MLKFAIYLFISFSFLDFGFAQDKEKLIVNQSLLLDAIREESIGNIEKSIQILEKLKLEPDSKAICNYYLSRIYRSLHRQDDALAAIEESVLTEPENKWYLVLKANIAEDIGRYTIVASVYHQLSALEPTTYSHFDNAALNYLKSENPEKALEILNLAQNKFGLLPPLAFKKARILTNLNKTLKAIELLDACLALFPNHHEILVELIALAREEKNQALTDKYITQLKKMDPSNSFFSEAQETETKQTGKNQLDLNSIFESSQYNLDEKIKVLFYQLDGFAKSGNKTAIEALLPYAHKLYLEAPQDPKTSALYGDLYFQLEDLFKAKEFYQISIKTGNVPYSVWDNLLFCLIHMDHWNTASRFSNLCMDFYPSQSFPLYVYLLSKFHLSEFDGIESSLKTLELMVEHNPSRKRDVSILKALVLERLAKYQEAEKVWDAALKEDPTKLVALNYQSYLARNLKPIDEIQIESILKDPNVSSSLKSYKIAEIYVFKKEYQKAKNYIEQGIHLMSSKHVDYFLLASKIYKELGVQEKELEYKLKAQELSDQNAGIQTK
ncbi:MAG: hypothetical protein IPG12_09800 [Saprospiraceae bacterium]|nr:hypothetical protein [Saprospiraceae bacterium]